MEKGLVNEKSVPERVFDNSLRHGNPQTRDNVGGVRFTLRCIAR